MKSHTLLLLCLAMLFLPTGCGSNSSGRPVNAPSGVKDLFDSAADSAGPIPGGGGQASDYAAPDSENAVPYDVADSMPAAESGNTASGSTAGVDVDLTALSSTVVYSEVYNMMVNPENYLGKTVKMSGALSIYHDESTGINYFACVIADATACCAQGIEFELTGDYSYPEDYPEPGTVITVVGVFDTYMEGQNRYCTLRGAILL